MKTLALTILLALATTTPALADEAGDKQLAQKLLGEGLELLNQNKPTEALAKFRSAYGAYPSPSLLLNIGTTLRTLGRHAEAANAYARWLLARANPQHRAEVEEILADLDRRVGRVSIEVDAGASLTVDGKPVDLAGDVIRLEPGAHAIVASLADGRAARATVQVRAGETETVKLAVEPKNTNEGADTGAGADTATDADAAPGPIVTKPASGGGSGTVLKIAGISTAAIGLIAVGVGVKYGLDARDINDQLEGVGPMDMWSQELFDKFDEGESAETKFIAFTAIGGAAIIAGGVMSYLGFTRGGGGGDSLALAPSVTGDSAGWVVSGRF